MNRKKTIFFIAKTLTQHEQSHFDIGGFYLLQNNVTFTSLHALFLSSGLQMSSR